MKSAIFIKIGLKMNFTWILIKNKFQYFEFIAVAIMTYVMLCVCWVVNETIFWILFSFLFFFFCVYLVKAKQMWTVIRVMDAINVNMEHEHYNIRETCVCMHCHWGIFSVPLKYIFFKYFCLFFHKWFAEGTSIPLWFKNPSTSTGHSEL